MARPRDRKSLPCLALALLLGCNACGGPSAEPEAALVRFIETEPQEIFELAGVTRRQRVFTWSFDSDEALAPWVLAPVDQSLVIRGGAAVPVRPQRRLILTRDVDLEAGTVDAVVLQAKRIPARKVELRWVRAGESGAPSGRLEATPQVRKKGTGRVTFAVADHPQWSDRIDRIELRFAAGDGLRLLDVRGEKTTAVEAELERVRSQSFKLALGNDLRNALLAPPGHSISRQVEVPAAGARLQVAYGVQQDVRDAVRFRAFIEAGTRREALLDKVLKPGAREAWRQANLDLGRFAGQRVTITLETTADGELPPQHGFPAWANPIVYSAAPGASPPNVVLISVDTLRADHLSLYGYPRPTSPNLEAWARTSAAVFHNAVAPAPWTLPSHTSMLTGLNAHRHGVNHSGPVPQTLVLLAERLRQAGYSTRAITGGAWLHPSYHFAQGFDSFRTPAAARDPKELRRGLDAALRWLDAPGPRPFFLFFHTYEVHWPYRDREPYFSQFSRRQLADRRIVFRDDSREGGLARVRYLGLRDGDSRESNRPRAQPLPDDLADLPVDLYDSGIAYMDAGLGRLFERLQRPDLADRTIVVLTSDHGEMLGEHGLASHYYLYDENLMVPLIVGAPGKLGAGTDIETQVRVIDVVPTILELAGLPAAVALDGASLVPLIEGRSEPETRVALSYAAKSNFGLAIRARNRLKYVFNHSAWPQLHGRETLFRLDRDSAENDPLEAASDIDSAPEIGALRQLMRSAIDEESAGVRVSFKNTSDRTLEGQLRGSSIWAGKVKALAMPCDCVTFLEAGLMEFEVPPGITYTLVLEGVSGRRLDASVAWPASGGAEPASFDQELRFESLVTPQTLAFDDGAWRFGDSASMPEHTAGITFWWRGESRPDVAQTSGSDAELEAQLRALGYL